MKDSTKRLHLPVSKEDFCLFCHLLYERHLVGGVGGNLSVRIGERIFMTPSGYSLRDLTVDNVLTLNTEGNVVEGSAPTKDVRMHMGILDARPDINVICHVHGAFIIASSSIMAPGPDSLPPITPGFVYFAYPLPMIPFMVPGTDELVKAVTRQFLDPACRALLLQNHGLVTIGETFSEALNIAEEIDEAARVYALTAGRARVISTEDISRIKSFKT